MALVRCPECGRDVSERAVSCPQCACPIAGALSVPPTAPVPTAPVSPIAPVAEAAPQVPAKAAVSAGSFEPEYKPVLPPREIAGGAIVLGIALIALGLWLSLSFVPAHDPANSGLAQAVGEFKRGNTVGGSIKTAEEILKGSDEQQWYLKEPLVGPAKAVGWVFAVLGTLELIVGGTYRPGKLAFCRKCNRQVVANRVSFGFKCERCGTKV